MKLLKLIEYIRARLRTVVYIGIACLVLLVGLDMIPAVVNKEHAHTAAERFPAFWSLFGFIGCVLIIIISKAFGHAGIMKREDYYDE